jgi:hypothetical protein
MTTLRNVDGMPLVAQAAKLLGAIGGRAPRDQFVEARSFTAHGVKQQWWSTGTLEHMAEDLVARGQVEDIYVGAARRVRRGGTAADVAPAWVLWCDLDDPQALADVGSFDTPPHLVVATSAGHAHAWWCLAAPLEPRHLPRALRRLTHHLRGDMKSTDAARVMRVPGTRSHKHRGERVELITFNPQPPVEVRTLVGALADPVDPRTKLPASPVHRPSRAAQGHDPLLAIPASVYVPALTGRPLQRGFVKCPWHAGGDERTPSLHAYPDPDMGWYCFGCERGGSIIDFGAMLWGIDPSGRGYHEIRERLARALGVTLAEAA